MKGKNNLKIAVSGKGGVGKTTISATISKILEERGYKVYAVDADPDSSLGLALGMSLQQLEMVNPVIEMRDVINERSGNGAIFPLNPDVSDLIDKFSIKNGNIRFFRMGGVKKGGSDCYCRENTFLRALVDSFLLDSKDAVVLDMGAGIEHLTRGTSRGVDLMLVITEPGLSSLKTARLVEKLAKDIDIKEVKFIANKIKNDDEASFIYENFKKDELGGIVEYSEEIAGNSMKGKAVGADRNSQVYRVLSQVVDNYLKRQGK